VLTRAGSRGQSSGGQLDEAPETEESAEVGMIRVCHFVIIGMLIDSL